jgi:hypothetical protein
VCYTVLSLFPDVGEIRTRLFDHRPFLSGEIKFFLKEFEVRSQKFSDLVNELHWIRKVKNKNILFETSHCCLALTVVNIYSEINKHNGLQPDICVSVVWSYSESCKECCPGGISFQV